MDQVLVGFFFVPPLHSLAMQLIFLQDNTTTSSSGLTPEENQHQRKPEEQGGENNADEKENSSEVEKAEVPLKEVTIGGAAETSMSKKVENINIECAEEN